MPAQPQQEYGLIGQKKTITLCNPCVEPEPSLFLPVGTVHPTASPWLNLLFSQGRLDLSLLHLVSRKKLSIATVPEPHSHIQLCYIGICQYSLQKVLALPSSFWLPSCLSFPTLVPFHYHPVIQCKYKVSSTKYQSYLSVSRIESKYPSRMHLRLCSQLFT